MENENEKTLKLNELLKRVLYNQKEIDKWLSFPHPHLGGKTPKEVINSGYIDAVITLIEGALSGDMA